MQESFEKIRGVVENCYEKDLRNILIITGKGLRSKVKENPYLSEDLSLLKYAIPNFIKDNFSDIINSIIFFLVVIKKLQIHLNFDPALP